VRLSTPNQTGVKPDGLATKPQTVIPVKAGIQKWLK
jgi:hypothetical protein